MTTPESYGTWQFIKDIGALVRKYRGEFWLGMFLRFSSDVVWLYPAYALGETINILKDSVTDGIPPDRLWLVFGLWIAASMYHYINHDLCKYFVYQVAEKCSLDAQINAMRHMFLLDLSWHERENSGNKLKRMQNAGDSINRTIRIVVDNISEIFVNFVGMIFIIAFFDRQVALVVFVFMVTYFTLSYFLTRRAAAAAYVVNQHEEDLQGISFESINNIRTVKVLRMGRGLLKILRDGVRDLVARIRTRISRFRSRGAILNLWSQIFRLLIVAMIVFGIINGRYEVGFLALAYTYFNKIWESTTELSDTSSELVVAKYRMFRMKQILDAKIVIEHESGKRNMPKDWHTIEVRDVSFGYTEDVEPSRRVLHKVGFQIRRGQKIGLVGMSGAGKSTLFKLLLKEHENYDGMIKVGDANLKKIKKQNYLEHVAVVLQDTELFNMSLKENILIAAPHMEFDTVRFQHALEIAHVSDFLEKLPLGVDSIIGEKGIKLSGGEKQRLGIARAVYRNPELLFLDEATSHLDIESEKKIQASLHKIFQNITAVVIAHRLSTIKEMDRIIVLEAGCILEEGNFDELMQSRGRFYELWRQQKL